MPMCHGEDNNQMALEYSELSFLSQTNDKNMYVMKKIWCDHTHSSEINVGSQGYLTLDREGGFAQTQRLQLNDVSLNRVTAIIMGTYQIGREEKKDREHKEHSDKRTN